MAERGESLQRSGSLPTTPGGSHDGGPFPGSSLLSCRIKVTMPETLWMQQFTTDHPEVRLDVLDRLELGAGLTLLEVRVVSPQEGNWSEEIRSLKGVQDVEVVAASGGSETCRVYFRGTTFIPLIKRLRLLRHFPFPIENGVATWTVVGPSSKVKQLLRVLESDTPGVQVDAVRHGPLPENLALLTPRQHEILRIAMREGYFDVPRRISLTELAPKVGVAISTLSVTLAVIEKKILEPHV